MNDPGVAPQHELIVSRDNRRELRRALNEHRSNEPERARDALSWRCAHAVHRADSGSEYPGEHCWIHSARKVNKNELIVFSEKIDAVAAQRGFFVARSFTKDARAQAAKDKRITLLLAKALSLDALPRPFGCSFSISSEVEISIQFKVIDEETGLGVPNFKVDEYCLDGTPVSFEVLALAWRSRIWALHAEKFNINHLPDGTFPVDVEGTMLFELGRLTSHGHHLNSEHFHARFDVRVMRPVVLSYWDVEKRGRIIQMGSIELLKDRMVRVNVAEIEGSENKNTEVCPEQFPASISVHDDSGVAVISIGLTAGTLKRQEA